MGNCARERFRVTLLGMQPMPGRSALPFLAIVMWLAALGFIVSLMIHLGSLIGIEVFAQFFWLLPAVFLIWIPTVWVGRKAAQGFSRRDFWKRALQGCPEWMRRAVGIIFAYGILNFLFFLLSVPKAPRVAAPGHMTLPEIRAFSGHLLIFYSTGFAVLYSAIRTRRPQ